MKPSRRSSKIFAFAALISVVSVASATASWLQNGNPVCTASTDQAEARVAALGGGNSVIVWEDPRSGDYRVYAQYVDFSGAMIWGADGKAVCSEVSTQRHPRAVADGAGGVIITWDDYRNGNWHVYAQRLDAGGNALWPSAGVAVRTGNGGSCYPCLVGDGANGAIVVWQDFRGGDWNSEIYAQRLDASGSAQWTSNGVAVCTAPNNQESPEMVTDGSGGAVVTWEDFRGGSSYDVYVQRLDGSGNGLWTGNGVALTATTGSEMLARIATDGSGGAIVTWQYTPGGSTDVFAQRVNAVGSVCWAPNGIIVCADMSDQLGPEIAYDGAGGAIIAWYDMRSLINYDIYAQRVDTTGVTSWIGNGVGVCTEDYGQMDPTVAADGSGGAIIAWRDYRNANHFDIYAQRVDALGNEIWPMNGVLVCGAPGNQFEPRIVPDGSGGGVLAWVDYRSGTSYDVYAQRVSDGGLVAGFSDSPPALATGLLAQNVPNPFNPVTTIRFNVAAPGRVKLAIYDVSGNPVRLLVDAVKGAGWYETTWDGRDENGADMASGVYECVLDASDSPQMKKMVLLR